MNWRQNIKVDIAGRPYPFRVDREEDEHRIRKAGKLINEKISQLKSKYVDKDVQDLLAFAALQFAVKTVELDSNAANSSKREDRLENLNSKLEAFLKKCEKN